MKTASSALCLSLLLVVVFFTLPSCGAWADTYSVTSASDSGAGTLRELITNTVTDGDTIEFDSTAFTNDVCTITLNSSISISASISIVGPSDKTVILTNTDSYVLYSETASTEIILKNLTFSGSGANSTKGGAVYVNEITKLTVTNCIFSGNELQTSGVNNYGAAIYARSTDVDISKSTFSNNKISDGDGSGGAVYLRGGTSTVSSCIFESNSIISSSDSGRGAAIYINSAAILTVSNTIFNNNTIYADVASYGGAIYSMGTLTVISSSFVENKVSSSSNQGNGGAIFINITGSILNLANCIFYGNEATDAGSAIRSFQTFTVNIYSSTIINKTGSNVSCISSYGSGTTQAAVKLENTIVSETNGDSIAFAYADVTFVGTNFFENIDEGTSTTINGSYTSGTSVGDLLLTLKTLTSSAAQLQVLVPQADSPVIDTGTEITDETTLGLESDIRGVSRPQGSGWDVGAVEYISPAIASISASNVSASGALVTVTLNSDADEEFDTVRIYYTTGSDPLTSDTYADATNNGDGTYTLQLSGLVAGTTYTLQATGTYGTATDTGDTLTITTAAASSSDGNNGSDEDDSGDGNDDDSVTLDDSLLLWRNLDDNTLYSWRLDVDGILQKDVAGAMGHVSTTQALSGDWSSAKVLHSGDETIIFMADPDAGEVVCWRLNGSGALFDKKVLAEEDADFFTTWRMVGATTLEDMPVLYWQKKNTTTLAIWRFTVDCALKNTTQGSGWDIMSVDLSSDTDWQALAVFKNNNSPEILWRNAESNQLAYWKLSDKGVLGSLKKNQNWGLLQSDTPLSTEWSLQDTLTIDGTATLFWRNSSSGKVVYWQLNSDSELQDWGFVSEREVDANWDLVGAFTLIETPALIWHNHSSGEVCLWKLDGPAVLISMLFPYYESVASTWKLFGLGE